MTKERIVLVKRPKFFCINDDMDTRRPRSYERIRKMIAEFFRSYFPHPSSFERAADASGPLPPSQPSYIWQHPLWRSASRRAGVAHARGVEEPEESAAALRSSRDVARALQHGVTVDEFLALDQCHPRLRALLSASDVRHCTHCSSDATLKRWLLPTAGWLVVLLGLIAAAARVL